MGHGAVSMRAGVNTTICGVGHMHKSNHQTILDLLESREGSMADEETQ